MSSTDKHPIIDDQFEMLFVTPEQMDGLWAEGWRHFGTRFFRYNLLRVKDDWQSVLALRMDLQAFEMSKSQRRTWRKNGDLNVFIRPVIVNEEKIVLFERHKQRFTEFVPRTIYTFLSRYPARIPCQCVEICAYDGRQLVAVAFLDVGIESVSSVYAMFDPDSARRQLGIYTMLLEIEFARRSGKRWYYSGYTTTGTSHYDYKKRFHALESYDFVGAWRPFERVT